MKLKVLPVLLFVLAATRLHAQDFAVGGISFVPAIAWQGASNQFFSVQRTAAIGDDWQTVGFVSACTNGEQRWVDTNAPAETQYLYRVELIPNVNRPFADGFEIAGGWSDQFSPAWTSRVVSGTWSGNRCFTVDDPSFAHESDRCVGMFRLDWSPYLELPRVDYPTQVVFWARSMFEGQGFTLEVVKFEGAYWSYGGPYFSISSTNYARNCVTLYNTKPDQRVRIIVNGGSFSGAASVFIDDIQVFTK